MGKELRARRLQEFSTREKDGDEPNEQERTESKAVRITVPQSPHPINRAQVQEVLKPANQYMEEEDDEAESCDVEVPEAELVSYSLDW